VFDLSLVHGTGSPDIRRDQWHTALYGTQRNRIYPALRSAALPSGPASIEDEDAECCW